MEAKKIPQPYISAFKKGYFFVLKMSCILNFRRFIIKLSYKIKINDIILSSIIDQNLCLNIRKRIKITMKNIIFS